jgi:hypothetical protein
MSRSKVNSRDLLRWSSKRVVLAKFQEMDNSRTEPRYHNVAKLDGLTVICRSTHTKQR